MNRIFTEKQLLHKLGASDFSNLSVDQTQTFASLIPYMKPEMAKSVMNSFADFQTTATYMVSKFRFDLANARNRGNAQADLFEACSTNLNTIMDKLLSYDDSAISRDAIEDTIILTAQMLFSLSNTFLRRVIKRAGNDFLDIAVGAAVIGGIILAVSATKEKSDKSYSSDDENDQSDYDSIYNEYVSRKNAEYDYNTSDEYEDDDEDYETRLSVSDAADIWMSNGQDEDYMFGYSEEELRSAL